MGTYDTIGGTPRSPDDLEPLDPFDLIVAELDRQRALPNSAAIAAVEATNTLNDRIAIALAYLGRAAAKVQRNEREKCDHVENLVKAAAVIYRAIEVACDEREAMLER